jgi:hypothetical protein
MWLPVVWRLRVIAVSVSMLLGRGGESVTELLAGLDLAIAQAPNEGIHTDEVNRLHRNASPANES